jgi:hypothetical protein
MKIMKWSSILLLSVFFMWAFIPQLSAKHHCKHRTSFGLSFNLAPAANYIVAPTPVVAPAPVMAPVPVVAPAPVAPVAVYRPYYGGAIYPYYNSVYVPSVTSTYVQPSFSYSYWRY